MTMCMTMGIMSRKSTFVVEEEALSNQEWKLVCDRGWGCEKKEGIKKKGLFWWLDKAMLMIQAVVF